MTDSFGAQYVISGSVSEVQGRTATLKIAGTMEGKTVSSVKSVGPSGRTMAEQEKVEALLAILQGTSSVFDSPFLKTLFPDGKEVVWPEDMPTLEETPSISFTQRPLNPSQEEAVHAMLSLNNDTRILVVQGPPGTGKTTVSLHLYCRLFN